MKLFEAKQLATQLMDKHGLLTNGWYFHFDSAKRRFGCCHYGHKRISLSRELVELNDEARVKNTILHEIAHALVGRGHGHNHVWRAKAIEIGCDGNRCYTSETTKTPEANYQAICPKCGHTHKRHRKPNRETSCGKCSRVFDRERMLVFVSKEQREFKMLFG